MIRKPVLLLASFLMAAACAQAQLAAYGTVTVARYSGVANSPYGKANAGVLGGPLDSVSPIGFTFGAYYDFMSVGPVRLGADLRGSAMRSVRGALVNFNDQGVQAYSALGGVRGTFHTPWKWMAPYVQASAGFGRGNGFTVTGKSTGLEYHGYAGVDLRLLPVMDFRLGEVGYGGLDANGYNYPIKSVSTGLVFHLPRNE